MPDWPTTTTGKNQFEVGGMSIRSAMTYIFESLSKGFKMPDMVAYTTNVVSCRVT